MSTNVLALEELYRKAERIERKKVECLKQYEEIISNKDLEDFLKEAIRLDHDIEDFWKYMNKMEMTYGVDYDADSILFDAGINLPEYIFLKFDKVNKRLYAMPQIHRGTKDDIWPWKWTPVDSPFGDTNNGWAMYIPVNYSDEYMRMALYVLLTDHLDDARSMHIYWKRKSLVRSACTGQYETIMLLPYKSFAVALLLSYMQK